MKTLKLNDREYKIATFDVKLEREFLDLARTKIPDPIEFFKSELKNLPEQVLAEMAKEALALKRQPINMQHPDVVAFLRTPEGTDWILHKLWSRHQPDLTLEQVHDLHELAVKEYGESYPK